MIVAFGPASSYEASYDLLHFWFLPPQTAVRRLPIFSTMPLSMKLAVVEDNSGERLLLMFPL